MKGLGNGPRLICFGSLKSQKKRRAWGQVQGASRGLTATVHCPLCNPHGDPYEMHASEGRNRRAGPALGRRAGTVAFVF